MNAEQLTKKQIESVNRQDIEAFKSCYASGAVVVDPQYAEPLKGHDAIGKDIAAFWTALPDLQLHVVNTIAQGTSYSAEITMSGTHKGALLTPTGQIPPTGKKIDVNACLVGRYNNDGRIIEEHRYYDLAGMLAQLGIAS